MLAPGVLAFSLARPIGLAALLLPIIVWILARARRTSRTLATGTIAVWSAAAARDPRSGVRRRARFSLAFWIALVALVLGALALAGPELAGTSASNPWRVHVDRRPAMYLADGDSTRLQHGLRAVEAWLADPERAHDEVEWIEAASERQVALDHAGSRDPAAARDHARTREHSDRRGREAPAEWLAPPRVPRSAPDWIAADEAGAIWVTDRAPRIVPRHALLVVSGGAAAPGPIAASGATRWDWDGERVVEIAHGARERRVAIDGALARPLSRLLETWAAARGLSADPTSTLEIALAVRTVRGLSGEREQAITAGRDGWRARGTVAGVAPSIDDDGDLETWLAAEVGDSASRALITRGSGRVWSAWSSMDDPDGDPAAFAVSIASLFDESLLPVAGVVGLADRMDAGSPRIVEPPENGPSSARRGGADGERRPIRLDAWLALSALAVLLTAIALALRSPPARGPHGVARARAIG